MNSILRIFNIALAAVVFYSVLRTMIKRSLNESNSILWLMIGFITLISGFFPGLINRIAGFLKVDYPPALLFLLAIIVLLLIAFKTSLDLSKTDAHMNEIAITLSLLREENKRLSQKLDQITGGATGGLAGEDKSGRA